MLGIQFIKTEPSTYLMAFQSGKIVKEGAGMSMLYFAPTTSLVAVPIGSKILDFIDQPVTADFQTVTVQGQVSFRVSNPQKLSTMMNYSLRQKGNGYASSDPEKLNERVFGVVKVLIQAAVKEMTLKQALLANDHIAQAVERGLAQQTEIQSLGLEILRASVLAVKPTPETLSLIHI